MRLPPRCYGRPFRPALAFANQQATVCSGQRLVRRWSPSRCDPQVAAGAIALPFVPTLCLCQKYAEVVLEAWCGCAAKSACLCRPLELPHAQEDFRVPSSLVEHHIRDLAFADSEPAQVSTQRLQIR